MINLIVALQCEAKPLIRHYGLTGHNVAGGYRLYQNRTMQLIVSGVGPAASAAAVALLFGMTGQVMHVPWVNVGVAGRANRALGTPMLAHKITDVAASRCWYPPRVFDAPCETAHLCTVARPEEGYDGDKAFDMEASGFYAAANRFATAELVQVLKVVSDNDASGPANVSAELVEALVAESLPVLDALIAALTPLAVQVVRLTEAPRYFDECVERWHFTVSQQHRLTELLRRWQALAPDEHPLPGGGPPLRQAGDVLAALAARLDQQPVGWAPDRD